MGFGLSFAPLLALSVSHIMSLMERKEEKGCNSEILKAVKL